MTASTKKPRAARRRKAKSTPMNGCKIETLEKVTPTSTIQLPVVITPESRTLFDYALLPLLYLEEFTKLLLKRLSPSTFK